MKTTRNAFSRFNILMATIAATFNGAEKMRLASGYKSRGHGKGIPGKNYFKSKSKYVPHTGKSQIERAKRQGLHMVNHNGFELIQRS